MEQTVYKAEKALIAAKFNGLKLETKKFDFATDSKKPEFVAKNPTGKVPFLETDMGCIFTSNAIARYVARCRADTALFGKSFDDEGSIDSWLEFCTHELEVPLMTWVYPVLGIMEDVPQVTSTAQSDVKSALTALETQLKSSKFLVGDFLSLADIALVCALREGFQRVFDPAFRKPYPKVCAWFECCCGMPQFKAVIGEVKLCSQPEKAKAVAPAQKPAKAEAKPAAKAAAAPAPAAPAAPAATGPADEAAVKAKGDEIRALKDKLKAEGKKGKEIDKDPQVAQLVAELTALKSGAAAAAPAAAAPAAPKAPAPAAAGGGEDAIKAKGDEIRALKDKLKAEGKKGKEIDKDPAVAELVAELQALKAGGAAPAPAAAPAAAAPAAAGGDVEAQVKAVGDKIRALKERLKGEGITGKKLTEHEEVAALVAELTELKKKL